MTSEKPRIVLRPKTEPAEEIPTLIVPAAEVPPQPAFVSQDEALAIILNHLRALVAMVESLIVRK